MAGTIYWNATDNGLCNRWRALLGVVGIAMPAGKTIAACWTPSPRCPVSIGELWQDFPGHKITAAEWEAADCRKIDPNSQGSVDSMLEPGDCKVFTARGLECLKGLWFDQANQHVTPKAEISDAVEAFTSTHFAGRRVLSVCARLSRECVAPTPADWFLQEIRQQPPETVFFVVADVAWFAPMLRREIGAERVLEWPRTTYAIGQPEIATAAFASVLAMASTPLVLSSFYSSMGHMPQLLNVNVRIRTPMREHVSPFEGKRRGPWAAWPDDQAGAVELPRRGRK